MGWNTLPSTRERPERIRLDWTGTGLIGVVVVASLVGVSQIGFRWWVTGVGAVLTAGAAVLYWRHSGRAAEPVLERSHLTRFPLRRIHATSGLVLIAGLAADNYLPLYTQTVWGWSEASAAFSVLFLTVGWSGGAVAVSRLVERFTESELIRGGAMLMPVAMVGAGISVATAAPLVFLFACYLLAGVAIGFVSTTGLTLLQSSSDPSEMGRTNSAHQFIRTLCITYGVAIGGAILLAVVDRRSGDVETVRDLLGGDDTAVNADTVDGIEAGFVAVHGFAVAAALGCVIAALALHRHMQRA